MAHDGSEGLSPDGWLPDLISIGVLARAFPLRLGWSKEDDADGCGGATLVVSAEPGTLAPVRVFISYAHDSDTHREAVREFWVLLRRSGIDARLDRTAAEQAQDWPLWMLDQVRKADFVLCVASPAYRRRAEGTEDPGRGLGVQWEAALIREEFYRSREDARKRFLPVLLPGASVDDVPAFFGPYSGTHYQVTDLSQAGIDALLRVLTGQPFEVEPPLGQVPVLSSRSRLDLLRDLPNVPPLQS